VRKVRNLPQDRTPRPRRQTDPHGGPAPCEPAASLNDVTGDGQVNTQNLEATVNATPAGVIGALGGFNGASAPTP
jgi:hypothetical protein